MSYRLRIADITIGGNGANDPVPLTKANYYLSPEEQKLTFSPLHVIATGYEVTGLVVVNEQTGQPMVAPNDPVFLPCPPLCP